MTKPFDLKNDPKFLARVKKLEGNQFVKVFKDPLQLTIQERVVYVAMIGQNDSYLIVEPLKDVGLGTYFGVFWTKSDNFTEPTPIHDIVSTQVLNWIMMNSVGDEDFNKLRHGSYDIKDVARTAIAVKLGFSYFDNLTSIQIMVQGTQINISNPYHK